MSLVGGDRGLEADPLALGELFAAGAQQCGSVDRVALAAAVSEGLAGTRRRHRSTGSVPSLIARKRVEGRDGVLEVFVDGVLVSLSGVGSGGCQWPIWRLSHGRTLLAGCHSVWRRCRGSEVLHAPANDAADALDRG